MHNCINAFHIALLILNTKQMERWARESVLWKERKGEKEGTLRMLRMGKEWRDERI